MSVISACDHRWTTLLDLTRAETPVVCTRCPAAAIAPQGCDPVEHAARLFPTPAARRARRRLLKPARVTR